MFTITLFFILSFVIWYPYNWFEYFLNSGNLGRRKYFFVFDCFFEDLKFYTPGCKKARIDFVKNLFPLDSHNENLVMSFHFFGSGSYTWSVKDLIYDETLDYDEEKLLKCFKDIMGEGTYFYLKNISILLLSGFIVFGH